MRLAGHVVQHPALARLHAGLVDAVAEHVVVVAHDDAPGRLARSIAPRAGCLRCPVRRGWDTSPSTMALFALEAVVRDGQEGAAERVEVGDGGRVGVDGGFVRGASRSRIGSPACADALFDARWAGSLRLAAARRIRSTSAIRLRIAGAVGIQHGVVDVQVVCCHGSKTTFS